MIIPDLDVSAAGVQITKFLDQSIFGMIPPRVFSVIYISWTSQHMLLRVNIRGLVIVAAAITIQSAQASLWTHS